MYSYAKSIRKHARLLFTEVASFVKQIAKTQHFIYPIY